MFLISIVVMKVTNFLCFHLSLRSRRWSDEEREVLGARAREETREEEGN